MANDAVMKITAVFGDIEKETATTAWFVSVDKSLAGDDFQGIADAQVGLVAALSNCAVVSYEWGFGFFGTRAAPAISTTENWQNVEDKAFLDFVTINGHPVRMQVPAPKNAVMLTTDLETVDPEATAPSALIAVWTATGLLGEYICDSDGHKVKEYNFGYRRRAKSRKERPGRAPARG